MPEFSAFPPSISLYLLCAFDIFAFIFVWQVFCGSLGATLRRVSFICILLPPTYPSFFLFLRRGDGLFHTFIEHFCQLSGDVPTYSWLAACSPGSSPISPIFFFPDSLAFFAAEVCAISKAEMQFSVQLHLSRIAPPSWPPQPPRPRLGPLANTSYIKCRVGSPWQWHAASVQPNQKRPTAFRASSRAGKSAENGWRIGQRAPNKKNKKANSCVSRLLWPDRRIYFARLALSGFFRSSFVPKVLLFICI